MFHHAHFNANDPADATVDPKLPALLAVVGLVESDLLALLTQCATAFPFDADGNCPLSADNISLLYAYSTLARVWRIAPSDLILVVTKLLLNTPGNDIRSLDLLEALQQQVTLLKSVRLPISEVFSLVDPTSAPVTIDAVISAVTDFQQSGAQRFGVSALTSLPGIKTEDATAILTELVGAGLLASSGDQYRLTPAYMPGTDLSSILDLNSILTPPLQVSVADIHAALMAFHFINLLPNMLAPIAGMDVEKRCVIHFALAQAGWDSAAM
jgi:hypothetical protein